MKRAVREKWLDALRSGRFRQGRSALRSFGTDEREEDRWRQGLATEEPKPVVRHCCLGVLCELAREDGVGDWIAGGDYPRSTYAVRSSPGNPLGETCDTYPPAAVLDWAGLSFAKSRVLAQLNDHGIAFDVIAQTIEAYDVGLADGAHTQLDTELAAAEAAMPAEDVDYTIPDEGV